MQCPNIATQDPNCDSYRKTERIISLYLLVNSSYLYIKGRKRDSERLLKTQKERRDRRRQTERDKRRQRQRQRKQREILVERKRETENRKKEQRSTKKETKPNPETNTDRKWQKRKEERQTRDRQTERHTAYLGQIIFECWFSRSTSSPQSEQVLDSWTPCISRFRIRVLWSDPDPVFEIRSDPVFKIYAMHICYH